MTLRSNETYLDIAFRGTQCCRSTHMDQGYTPSISCMQMECRTTYNQTRNLGRDCFHRKLKK